VDDADRRVCAGVISTLAALFVWSWLRDDQPAKLHWLSPGQVAKLPPDLRRKVMRR